MARKSKASKASKKETKLSGLARFNHFIKSEKEMDHIVPLSKESLEKPHEAISTSNVILDYAIGGAYRPDGLNMCAGPPRGAITQIFGTEHSGKTSFCLHTAAQIIREGGSCLYVDYEHILSPHYARKLGIPVSNPNKFILYQPNTLEEGVAAVMLAAESGVDLVVFDSVGAAIPKKIFDGGVEGIRDGDSNEGGLGFLARRWSELLGRVQSAISANKCALIAVSQTRATMGGPSAVQGGNSWKFWAALRIELRYIGMLKATKLDQLTNKKNSTAKVGSRIKMKIRKMKLAPTVHYECELDCIPGRGFDPYRSAVDILTVYGGIAKAGNHYTWERSDGSIIKGNGRENFMTAIYDLARDDDTVLDSLNSMAKKFLLDQEISDEQVRKGEEANENEVFDDSDHGDVGIGAEELEAIKKTLSGK